MRSVEPEPTANGFLFSFLVNKTRGLAAYIAPLKHYITEVQYIILYIRQSERINTPHC